eukprot:31551-Pelagococcus_subviridis.AAC.12
MGQSSVFVIFLCKNLARVDLTLTLLRRRRSPAAPGVSPTSPSTAAGSRATPTPPGPPSARAPSPSRSVARARRRRTRPPSRSEPRSSTRPISAIPSASAGCSLPTAPSRSATAAPGSPSARASTRFARAAPRASPPPPGGCCTRSTGPGWRRRPCAATRRTPRGPPEGRHSIQSDVGVELKGVRSGVVRRRGRVLKARDPGRRETPGKQRPGRGAGLVRLLDPRDDAIGRALGADAVGVHLVLANLDRVRAQGLVMRRRRDDPVPRAVRVEVDQLSGDVVPRAARGRHRGEPVAEPEEAFAEGFRRRSRRPRLRRGSSRVVVVEFVVVVGGVGGVGGVRREKRRRDVVALAVVPAHVLRDLLRLAHEPRVRDRVLAVPRVRRHERDQRRQQRRRAVDARGAENAPRRLRLREQLHRRRRVRDARLLRPSAE